MRAPSLSNIWLLASTVTAVPHLVERSSGTAKISLNTQLGAPAHLGSGILHGLPLNNPNDGRVLTGMPAHWYQDVGWNFARAGGAAWPAPNRGYAFGVNEYTYRFKDALSYYRTIRQYNGSMFLVMSDLWGVPECQVYPGDNDDWTLYDKFLGRVISDIKSNKMQAGLVIDMWNEPELNWPRRPYGRFHEMWARGYKRFRSELPSVLIGGPSTAGGPGPDNTVFSEWAQFVAQNKTGPDVYTWHALDSGSTPTGQVAQFDAQRQQLGLPQKDINLNEYLALDEEGPSAVIWYLSQLERLNIRGCRANWAKGGQNPETLHNLLANMLGPEDLSQPYYANGEYHPYRYYASNMTGQRVKTTPSADLGFDVYATKDTNSNVKVKVLAAARRNTNTYTVSISGWSAVGIKSKVSKRTLTFGWNGLFGQVGEPQLSGTQSIRIVNDAISFEVVPQNIEQGFAFEFFA